MLSVTKIKRTREFRTKSSYKNTYSIVYLEVKWFIKGNESSNETIAKIKRTHESQNKNTYSIVDLDVKWFMDKVKNQALIH